jgi:GAF domain-containing protein
MSDFALQQILSRLAQTHARDALVKQLTRELRANLQVDRIVLYYFYSQWEGQVTFEALSDDRYSILGSTGPDDCFNGEYAALYEAGRIREIEDTTTASLADCHRDFLLDLQVKANLVAPILTSKGLWGLLVAHHCQNTRAWSEFDRQAMQEAAKTLAEADSIKNC